jgi:hypothetical protein
MNTLCVEMQADQVPLFAVRQLVSVDAMGVLHQYTVAALQKWRVLDIQSRTAVLVPA